MLLRHELLRYEVVVEVEGEEEVVKVTAEDPTVGMVEVGVGNIPNGAIAVLVVEVVELMDRSSWGGDTREEGVPTVATI